MIVQHSLQQAPDAFGNAPKSARADQSTPSASAQCVNSTCRQRLVATCGVLRFLIIVSAIVTAVFALSLWAITIIPAIALAVLFGLRWLAAIEEDVEQAREDMTGEHRAIH